jgi:hypothetical protein
MGEPFRAASFWIDENNNGDLLSGFEYQKSPILFFCLLV